MQYRQQQVAPLARDVASAYCDVSVNRMRSIAAVPARRRGTQHRIDRRYFFVVRPDGTEMNVQVV
jgi:hypothetical protein